MQPDSYMIHHIWLSKYINKALFHTLISISDNYDVTFLLNVLTGLFFLMVTFDWSVVTLTANKNTEETN